jgi:mannose-6-phosphate isomerase
VTDFPLYPLRFEPILQQRIWGGRRLADLFGYPLPPNEPIGEAWVLSDRDDFPSRVADGPLKGQTIRQVLEERAESILGRQAKKYPRFPLLLKFLDARDTLSVQVHPSDRHTELLPPGEHGKTEAWYVIQADPGSRIYAGLKPGTTPDDLRRALANRNVADYLASFTPKPGDGVFLRAGTIHALGGGLVIFECQQNSDVTFRLYDWDRTDAKTGQPRQLHIEQALACSDFGSGAVGPVRPVVESKKPIRRKRYFASKFFQLSQLTGQEAFTFRTNGSCRLLVGIEGGAELQHGKGTATLVAGDVVLVPAALGDIKCQPSPGKATTVAQPLTLLEIALPE